MSCSGGVENIELLFRYACAYEFRDFTERFHALASHLSAEALREAYLLRAQIKLFAADETLLDDLEEAARTNGAPLFPCLKDCWVPDGPNRFVVFKKTPGALRKFLQILPEVGEKLGGWYGEPGVAMARQVRSEILYFCGEPGEALALAKEQCERSQGYPADAMLSLYVQFRCHLAMGAQGEAGECMMEMIRAAKAHPECQAPYQVVRDWANLTTGWSGDNPRFYDVSRGEALPVLEDRLAAIRKGISRFSVLEEPFVAYAERSSRESYTMRQHYMDIFHALYWFQVEDRSQAETYFLRAYRVSRNSGIVMPFAEYGRQIVPLLRYAGEGGIDCAHDWIAAILSLAERYEKGLQAYRA